jgi:putative transposase
MGRPKRADGAGGIYHALNRGNARSTIFHKPEDYEALEQILAEGLTRYACRILAYQLMPNHWHFVLQPTEDGGMRNFLRSVYLSRWLEEPEREPRLLSAWSIARSPRWTERVNRPLTAAELKAVRNSVNRGSPFGDENWVQAIARRLNLQSPLRPRGRPQKES